MLYSILMLDALPERSTTGIIGFHRSACSHCKSSQCLSSFLQFTIESEKTDMQQSWRRFIHRARVRGAHRVFSHPLKRPIAPSLAGLAFLLLLSGCSGSATPGNTAVHPTLTDKSTPTSLTSNERGVRQLADTWNNIHLFLTFDYSISNPATISDHYDFVWGAKAEHIAAFRSGNPNIITSYYIPFYRDNGTFADSGHYRDLSFWKTSHPDWILYKCDRITPAYEYNEPDVPLDFANPALVSWQVQTYALPASESGYDGIAADNVSLDNSFGACGVYVHGQWVQHYTGQPDDQRWRADVISWLTRMQQALHHLPHPLALITNLSAGNLPAGDSLLQQVVSHTDSVVDEAGFTLSGDGYLTDSGWQRTIQFMESVQQQHKAYYIINQIPSVDHTRIQWVIASYLMGKEHSAALYISTIQGYGVDTWESTYDAPIGSPTGPMYRTQGIYARNYSHGLILVNPGATDNHTVTLNPADQFKDLYGTPFSGTITMPPHSGLVLLASS